MEYLVSPIPDCSKPQCLICYEILSQNKKFSVKRHYTSKHSNSIEKQFPINSEARKKYIETQEQKLKQQRTLLKCLMTSTFKFRLLNPN